MVSLPKKIPIGVAHFAELIDPALNHLFVDKTLFIKEFIDQGTKVSLIIRPRRWGKTLNMSMIQHFFSPIVDTLSTKGMFDNLKIAEVDHGRYLQYQGQNPVLFISFKDVKENNFEDFLDSTKELMQEICNQYPELASSNHLSEEEKNSFLQLKNKNVNMIELRNGLKNLSIFLKKHYHQKVIILIDEYDTPLNSTYGKPYFEDLVNFFKGMFGSALKGNSALEKGIMTGILRLSKNKMLSDLNNLKLYSLIERQYSQHFGFTEKEVETLFQEAELKLDMQTVRQWYNGYFAGGIENMYNPWSVLNCIDDKGALKAYWIKTGNEELLKNTLLQASIQVKEKLNLLLLGQPIESIIDEYCSFDQIKGNEEALWSLLWALGYLKTVGIPQSFGTRYKYQLQIPNHEVAASYREIFQTFMNALPNLHTYDSFLRNLTLGHVEDFIKELEEYMCTISSFFDFPKESNYHTFLLGLTASLGETHHIYSNKEVGYGRPDMLLIPRDSQNTLGIILEFKKDDLHKSKAEYEKLALAGLQQIDIKKYDAFLIKAPTIHKILKMCIVFYGKEFVCQWRMEQK